jgi:ubiquinone/menaquinone biosynthesis C-methylase UbiE
MPYFTDEDARAIIRTTYETAAPTGFDVAQALYSRAELAGVVDGAVQWALGVGNPVRHAGLRPGDVVLDVGCGAGIDALVAARRVLAGGRVIGVDMTPAMLERARVHAAAMGLDNVEWREGLMEALPLPDASVDVVLCNGVLNLSTRKSRALAEMRRVLRPRGRLSLADLVVTESLPEAVQRDATALAV